MFHSHRLLGSLALLTACSSGFGDKGDDPKGSGDGAVNQAPTCEILSPSDDAAASLGDEVRFEAVADDADQSPQSLAVTWTSDLDGELRVGAPEPDGTIAFASRDLSAGTHRVSLLVEDDGGEACGDAVYLFVGEPPSLSIDAPDAGSVTDEGQALTLVVTAADGQDAPTELQVSFDSDLDGALGTATPDDDGVASLAVAALQWGAHTLSATVTDTDGLSTTATVAVTVNALPLAPTVSISPDPAVTTDDLVAVVTDLEDPDGSGEVTLTYAWSEDGAALAEVGDTLSADQTTKGRTYTVVVTPSDDRAAGPTGEASLTVSNADPTVDGPTLSESTVQVGDTLTCAATASDVDPGDSPTVTYTWHDGSTGDTYTVTADDDPGDAVTCTATADDADGGTASASASATVDNTEPVVTGVVVSPSSGQVGDTLTCSGTATDADGGTATWSYAWQDGSTGSTYTIVATDDPGDTLTCTATADDGDGGTDSDAATATVDNSDPVFSSVTISPSSATNDDTLTCSGTATDADGDTPTVTYAWADSSAGGSLGTGATLDLSATSVAGGATVACTATATDPHGGSGTDTASLALTNRAPSVSAVTVEPTTAFTDDTLTASATASDDDGDALTLTYEWTVDGTVVQSGSAATLDGSAAASGGTLFERDEVVVVTVTASDGTDSDSLASSSLTISNSPPVVATPEIGPTDAEAGDDLTCTAGATSTDADADTLTEAFTWFQDGTELTAAAGSSTLSGSYVVDGSTYTCVLTADDGTDSTSATSAGLEPCVPVTWYVDADGDGHGVSTATVEACSEPSGYAATDDDCDDTDSTLSPSANEDCDGIDNDCDGTVDEDDIDADGDGVRACDGDCDDDDASIHPGAIEICANGADDDCDGTTDTADLDGDGYGGCDGTDCNDYSDRVNPGETEVDGDGLDNDCDGTVDDSTTDDDGDGETEAAGDCDDGAAWISTAATEIPDSGDDEDCDGSDDTALSMTGVTYVDAAFGSDYFPGTYDFPVATLTQGVALASAAGGVVVATADTYTEDVTTDVSIFGGYADDWSGVEGTTAVEGDLVTSGASSTVVVSNVDLDGDVDIDSDTVLYGVTVVPGAVQVAVDASDAALTVVAGALYGSDSASGDITTLRFGASGGSVWGAAIVGGAATDGGNGRDGYGTSYEDRCGRELRSGSDGRAGSDGRSVTSIEITGAGAVTISDSLVVGGAAGAGGAGGNGSDGTGSAITGTYNTYHVYWFAGGGAGGDGGDAGAVVLVDALDGEVVLTGSMLTGGVAAPGGQGGTGGDAVGADGVTCSSMGSTDWVRAGYGGGGGDTGLTSPWHGALGNVWSYGSTFGGPSSLSGTVHSGGAEGASTSCPRWATITYCYGTSGTDGDDGESPLVTAIEEDSATRTPSSDPVIQDNVVQVQSSSVSGGWDGGLDALDIDVDAIALIVEDATVARNIVSLTGTGTYEGILATGTAQIESNLVEILGTDAAVGLDLTGEDILAVHNTVVLDGAGMGVEASGIHMVGLVNNLVQTGSGGTCVVDWTSTRDAMLNNLVWGCTSQLYEDSTGYRTRAAEMDFITTTTSAGGHVYDDPLFTDASGSDYTLGTGSPAIDAGTDVSSATYGAIDQDVLGQTCPVNSDYDIGALEAQ